VLQGRATKMSLQKVSERLLIAWESKTRKAIKVDVKITSVINQYFVDDVDSAR
jgi:G:T-mismatch repair DNA endonuclease (very short patch repair protein)